MDYKCPLCFRSFKTKRSFGIHVGHGRSNEYVQLCRIKNEDQDVFYKNCENKENINDPKSHD